jgi:hypothetical protein
MRQYARKVEAALRPVLGDGELPLVLAATEPMASIYRSVNTYPHLLRGVIGSNPERDGDDVLAAGARSVLDESYAAQMAEWRDLYRQRGNDGRATADLAHAARAATFGMIDTVLVDMDVTVPGTVDEDNGAVTLAAERARGRLRELFRVGRLSLAIGLTVMAAAILAADLIAGLIPRARTASIISESLAIGGWVALWRPMEIYLYDWWPIRAEIRLYDRLATATVVTASSGARA